MKTLADPQSGDGPDEAPSVSSRKVQAQKMRRLILGAALSEFAEKGFDGTSVRNIARRIEQNVQLISHYFPTKNDLWHAVADDAFTKIRESWDNQIPESDEIIAVERLRREYYLFFRFTIENPDFYQFILQEMRIGGARFEWIMEHYIGPLMARLIPQIRMAQEAGDLPVTEPTLLHHILIASTAAMATLAASIRATSSLSPDDEATRALFWQLIEDTIFRGRPIAED